MGGHEEVQTGASFGKNKRKNVEELSIEIYLGSFAHQCRLSFY
jgi:hypothetical protein